MSQEEVRLFKHQLACYKAMAQEVEDKRFIGLVSGFGGGKTYGASVICAINAIAYPGIRIGIYTLNFDLLKLNNLPAIEELLQDWGYKYDVNKTSHILSLSNGSEIIFRSMDNPGRIVGYETHICYLDEIDVLSEAKATEAYRKIYARNRAKRVKGIQHEFINKMLFTTTPEGYKFMWRTFEKEPTDEHLLIRAKTTDNKKLGKEYVETMKKIYPDQLIDAYINGEFVNLTSGSVYYAFDRTKHNTENYRYEYGSAVL